MMFNYKKYRKARTWSNQELAKSAHLFNGDVINVSGWLDEDKEGRFYQDYFNNCSSYTVSNYSGYRGTKDGILEIELDLSKELPLELSSAYDVVFNHTTLEHIFEIRAAVGNLCRISRDIVIIVVPFSQEEHTSPSYGDYWRITPCGMRAMLHENGMTVLHEAVNTGINEAIYLFCIASRCPEKWNKNPGFNEKLPITVGNAIGYNWMEGVMHWIKKRLPRGC